MAKWDILGFGVIAVDDLLYVETYPGPDSKERVVEERREGGGLAGTAMVAAARLGARVAFGGVLGDDDRSRFTIAALEREGVDCSVIHHQAEARPTHSTIVVERSTGRRTILYYGDGAVCPDIRHFEQAIAGCRVLFLDNTVAPFAFDAVAVAHAHGIPVVVDLERTPDENARRLAREADHVILGVVFAGRLTGLTDPAAMVRALRRPNHSACIVTVGEEGCWYSTPATGDEVQHWWSYNVKAVDTTGCGDVFHGAYATMIARGWSIDYAIRVATATAAIKATRPGGRSGIPDLNTVETFMLDNVH
jgi:sulfofructose kinase